METNYSELITICIPTYDRDNIILEGLFDLIKKIKKYNIPIIVVDNCSPGDTPHIVDIFKREYDGLSYFRQSENVGYDRNFETALKISKTPYTWVLGDGNRLVEENIGPMLKSIAENRPDAYIVDSFERAKKIAPKTYTSADDMLTEMGWHLTLLSATIFSKRVIEMADFERYRATNFLHLGGIFDFCAKADKFTFLWEGVDMIGSTTMAKMNTWHPYRVVEIFGRDWTKIILSLPDSISMEAKKKCIAGHGARLKLFGNTNLMLLRASRALTPEIYEDVKEYIKYFAPGKTWIMYVIARIPDCLNRRYRRAKRLGYTKGR